MTRLQILKLALAMSCAAAGLVMLNAGSEVSANQLAGEYHWIRTDSAQQDWRQDICDQERPGDDCQQLCMVLNNTQVFPTNRYCCVNPGDIGGLDTPEECTLTLP